VAGRCVLKPETIDALGPQGYRDREQFSLSYASLEGRKSFA